MIGGAGPFVELMKKSKKKPLPKPRHVWAINPKSRITPSKKAYARPCSKKAEKHWEKELLD